MKQSWYAEKVRKVAKCDHVEVVRGQAARTYFDMHAGSPRHEVTCDFDRWLSKHQECARHARVSRQEVLDRKSRAIVARLIEEGWLMPRPVEG